MRAIADANGMKGKPLWATEGGYGHNAELVTTEAGVQADDLRAPSFKGLRGDKDPRQVVREVAQCWTPSVLPSCATWWPSIWRPSRSPTRQTP